jgi:hypothetical protein
VNTSFCGMEPSIQTVSLAQNIEVRTTCLKSCKGRLSSRQ